MEKKDIYRTYIEDYGFAICRILSILTNSGFKMGGIEGQIAKEIMDNADAADEMDNIKNAFFSINEKVLKPYVDLYHAVNEAIKLTSCTRKRKNKNSKLYPHLLTQTYGVFFNKDIVSASYIDEAGNTCYFRDTGVKTLSRMRITSMDIALEYMASNETTGIIVDVQDKPYNFFSDENINLITNLMQIIYTCRGIDKKGWEDISIDSEIGKKYRKLTRRIYRKNMNVTTVEWYTEVMNDLLNSLEIETERSQWDQVELQSIAIIDNQKDKLTIRYKMIENDNYYSKIIISINGKDFASLESPYYTRNSNQLEYKLSDILSAYGEIESISVRGTREYDDRCLVLEASKKIGGHGVLQSLTNPSTNKSLLEMQLIITLRQILAAVKQINPEIHNTITESIIKNAANGYYSKIIWIVTVVLYILDDQHKVFK